MVNNLIEVPAGLAETYVGLELSIMSFSLNTKWTLDKLHRMLRRSIIANVLLNGGQYDENGNLPLTVKLPCGHSITYPDAEDVPMADIPCSCSNPKHWFIRYMDKRLSKN